MAGPAEKVRNLTRKLNIQPINNIEVYISDR